jgi:hypothetical protein
MPIHDWLEVGLLAEAGAFSHVACGGARVLGSPPAGIIDPRGYTTPSARSAAISAADRPSRPESTSSV